VLLICAVIWTYGENTFSEYDDVHVERLKVGGAVLILVETAETDKIIVAEQFYLLARFFHLDIFCRQRMDRKHLAKNERQSSTHTSSISIHPLY
jgi:hypothetical protein